MPAPRARPDPADEKRPQMSHTRLNLPETPADTRAGELRRSGYRGPIDQDGYENHDQDDVFAEMNRQRRIHNVPGYQQQT